MSDYNSSLPVRTENPGDIIAKLADSLVPSQQVQIDSNRNLHVMDTSAGSVAGGTVAANSSLAGGQYNTTPPTLTNGQQAALQLSAAGRLLVDTGAGGIQQTQDQADGPVSPGAVAANSILIGAQYNATLPTLADTEQAALQADSRGRLIVVSPTAANFNALVAQGAPGTNANGWFVRPTDGTNNQVFTAAGEANVVVTQPLPAGTNLIGNVGANLRDGAGNAITSQASGGQRALDVGINVAGVQVDPRAIRALTASDVVSANIRDAAGAAFSVSNPLPVTITSSVPGTEVNDYNTAAAVASGATSNHDYAITASTTFQGRVFWASASGKLKIEVQVSPDGVTYTTKWVGFNSTATPNISIELDNLKISESGTGATIRIIRTNLESQPMDVYSTISGTEV